MVQDEAAGRPVEEVFRVVNTDTRQPVENPAKRAMAEGRVVLLEANSVLVSKGGAEWPVDDSAAPITNDTGTAVGAVLVFREITERRTAERALAEASRRRDELLAAVQESEGYLRSVLDNSPDCIKVLDLEGRLLDMNRPGRCAMEIDAFDPLHGTDWPALWPEYGRDAARAAVESARRGEVARFQGPCPTAKGAAKLWDVRVAPIPGPDGRPARLVSVSRDVTAEKRAEIALRTSEAKFRSTVERLAEGVCVVRAGRFVEANAAMLDMLGYTLDEFVALDPFDIVAGESPEEFARNIAAMQVRLAASGRCDVGRREYRRKDGTTLNVDIKVSVVAADGAELHAVVVRDVTEEETAQAALRASEERFRAFMDRCPAVSYMKDSDGRFVYVNETLRRAFRVAGDGWIGKTDHDLFPAAYADEYRRHDLRVLGGDEAVMVQEVTPGQGGENVRWRSYKFPFVDQAGRRLLAGMSIDVTEEEKAQVAVRESEAKYRTVVEGLAEGVFLIDLDTMRVAEANGTFLKLIGHAFEELAALTLYDLVVTDRAMIDGEIRLAVEHGQFQLGRRQVRRKDGAAVDADVSVSHAAAGGRRLLAVAVRDVTEQRAYEDRLFAYQLELEEANAKLRAVAVTDGLTGVRNRAAFDGKLAEEYDRAVRYRHPLSVILMDVDHFKLFNDTFGHPAGDEVLKAVARTLRETARTSDFVARYGGEEFVAILPDTDYAGAMVVAERFRRAVAGGPWDQRPITVSVGVATLAPTTADAETLVQEADQALYRSKKAGRNRVTAGGRAVPALVTAPG